MVISLIYISLVIIIFIIDLEKQLVLDKVIYPAMALTFAFSFFWPGFEGINALPGEALGRAVSSLLGGIIGLGIMALPFIIYRSGMGMGDVKLGILVGLMSGYPLVFLTLLMSFIIGGLVAAILLTFKIKKRRDPIPFAPFLVTSAMITLLWGHVIWQWYL
ncbi:prepilin peptidase [Chloroflexota bacterium]